MVNIKKTITFILLKAYILNFNIFLVSFSCIYYNKSRFNDFQGSFRKNILNKIFFGVFFVIIFDIPIKKQ